MIARSLLLSLVLCAVLLTAGVLEAQTEILTPVWSKRFGDGASQWSHAVAADDAGNVVLAGFFQGSIDLGGGPLTSAGAEDIFVAKFDANGNHLWSKRFGDASSQKLRGVAIDFRGKVLMTGNFMGTVNFGGGTLTSAGDYDIFFAALNADGTYYFGERYGDASFQEGYGIACGGPQHSILITGTFQGSANFQGDLITSHGGYDVFMAAFDMDGSIGGALGFGGTGTDYGRSCAIDASGNAIITGFFQGTIDFGGGPLIGTGSDDAFLAKFNLSGAHLWSKRFGGSGAASVHGKSVAADDSGNVILAGDFMGSVSFGGSTLSASYYDMFLAKYDQSGNHLWSKDFGDSGDQFGEGVAADSGGNIAFVGYGTGAADFGGGPLAAAGVDLFIARFSANGSHVWSRRFGDAEAQYANEVAIDGSDNVIVAGLFMDTLTFSYSNPLISWGGSDVFVAKFRRLLGEGSPSIVSCLDIPNDQGGWLRLKVEASVYDVEYATYPITGYTAWRKIVPAPAALSGGIPAGEAQMLGLPPGPWETVAYANATQDQYYYFAVPTRNDSTASGIARETFIVTAHTTTPALYYVSFADSGYSVDNLRPAPPAGLEGEQSFSPAGLQLTWAQSIENDFWYYAVYRGTSKDFVPDPANRIAATGNPDWFDGGWTWGVGYYYKVSAIDIHGNESDFAILIPDGITGDETPKAPAATYLRQNYPNPFNPTTKIAFGLKEAGAVSLRIYDAAGRLVRALVDEQRAAGNYSEVWDGRDSSGSAVSSGIYFYRLSAGAFVETRKMAILR